MRKELVGAIVASQFNQIAIAEDISEAEVKRIVKSLKEDYSEPQQDSWHDEGIATRYRATKKLIPKSLRRAKRAVQKKARKAQR